MRWGWLAAGVVAAAILAGCSSSPPAEGFQMRHGDDAEDAYLWKDVENFRVGGEFETYQPVFDLVSRRGRNRKSGDYDVAIGDSYGMGSTGLCELLGRWQAKAVGLREA